MSIMASAVSLVLVVSLAETRPQVQKTAAATTLHISSSPIFSSLYHQGKDTNLFQPHNHKSPILIKHENGRIQLAELSNTTLISQRPVSQIREHTTVCTSHTGWPVG